MTLADRLIATKNRPAGFDWLRIGLSLSVVCWHTVITNYGMAVETGVLHNPFVRPPISSILGMFFALSGFLVAGSLERCRTMVTFVGLRVIRILPALGVEVLLSALILGPLLTHVSLGQYFGDRDFAHYFLNVLGLIHYNLPGVFGDNPFPHSVNLQLWTVPHELECYLVLTVISLVGCYTRRRVLLAAAAVALLLVVLDRLFHYWANSPPPGVYLISSFLVGVMLYRFRDVVRWDGRLALGAAVAAVICFTVPGGYSIAPVPLGYLTVYLGLLNPPKSKLLFSGDYSYGIFLYGFPVQQSIAALGSWTHHWYVALPPALAITAMIAVGSWWLIEKPVLARKAGLIWLEDRYLAIAAAARSRMRGRLHPAGVFEETGRGRRS